MAPILFLCPDEQTQFFIPFTSSKHSNILSLQNFLPSRNLTILALAFLHLLILDFYRTK
jgi:hypothetical protein